MLSLNFYCPDHPEYDGTKPPQTCEFCIVLREIWQVSKRVDKAVETREWIKRAEGARTARRNRIRAAKKKQPQMESA